jgi:hypothetical protein
MRKQLLTIGPALCLGFLTLVPLQAGSPGEIIFSSSKAAIKKNGSVITEREFEVMDELYLSARLAEPLQAVYNSLNVKYDFRDASMNFNYALRIYIDGEREDTWMFEMPADDFRSLEELVFILNTPDEQEQRKFSYTIGNWKKLVSGLQPGTHRVRIELVPLNTLIMDEQVPVLASGSMKLKVDLRELEDFSREIPVELPRPVMVNSELEKDILSASENVYLNLEPRLAIITDAGGGWSFGSDEQGNILRRYIIASVLYRNTLAGDCVLRSAVYYQDHKGYGTFGDTFYLKPAVGYYHYALPCDIAAEK